MRRPPRKSLLATTVLDVVDDQFAGADYEWTEPEELAAGVYANIFAVWHTAYEFTIDFAATLPPEQTDPGDPDSPLVVPCRLVVRARIPVTLAFDLIRALNASMTEYEERFGEIKRPGQEDTR